MGVVAWELGKRLFDKAIVSCGSGTIAPASISRHSRATVLDARRGRRLPDGAVG
jgi:hypothetical protein